MGRSYRNPYRETLTGAETLLLLPFIEKAYVRMRPLRGGVAGRPLYEETLTGGCQLRGGPYGGPYREAPYGEALQASPYGLTFTEGRLREDLPKRPFSSCLS